jgi:hypothetical protein
MPAFGAFTHAGLPRYNAGAGIKTEFGTFIPDGEVVAYVHSSGVVDGMDQDVKRMLYTSINSALALCRSGKGDIVVVLPGHTESIGAADKWSNLVAGTKIIGLGNGNNRPTVTWTAAGGTVLFDVANVTLSGFILNLCSTANAGVTVAAPITISAAGCTISDCDIYFGGDADDIVTIGITTTAAADDLTLANLCCYGATAAECTTFLRLVGTDRLRMHGCLIDGATSSTTVGVLQMLTTAPTQVMITDCTFVNRKASSVHAATGVASATGNVVRCNFGILDEATLPGWETEGNLQFFACYTANLAGEEGALKTPTSA